MTQEQPVDQHAGHEPKKSTSKLADFWKHLSPLAKTFGLGALLSVVVAVVGVLTVIGFGIYSNDWNGPVTKSVSRMFPYPAATVDGNLITYSEFSDDVDAIKRFLSSQNNPDAVAAMPADSAIRGNVLDRLIQMEVAKNLAVKYDIKVEAGEIDALYDQMSKDSEGGSMESELASLYGWSVPQFKAKVLEPYLLLQKLEKKIHENSSAEDDAKKQAEDMIAKIQAGEKFEDLAAKFSADPSNAQQGGDLGWFGKGTMVKEFEDAAFALKIGEVSAPVVTQFGVHVIRLEEVEKDKKGEVTKVHARHILIAPKSIEDVLKDEVAKAKVTKFIKL